MDRHQLSNQARFSLYLRIVYRLPRCLIRGTSNLPNFNRVSRSQQGSLKILNRYLQRQKPLFCQRSCQKRSLPRHLILHLVARGQRNTRRQRAEISRHYRLTYQSHRVLRFSSLARPQSLSLNLRSKIHLNSHSQHVARTLRFHHSS